MAAMRYIAAATSLLATVTASSSDAAKPRPSPCPSLGATYVSRAAPGMDEVFYRLKIESLPKTDDAYWIATRWRIETLAKNGRKLSELRMQYSCPNGRGPCSVYLPGRCTQDDGYTSEVIKLRRDFTLARGDRAGYALLTPGFAQSFWLFPNDGPATQNLTFFTPEEVRPNLQDHQVWLLVSCG